MPDVLRSWYGEVLGFVPYDFRVPTMGRMIHSVWAPNDARLLMPMAFGVGWNVNFGRIVRQFAEWI